MCTAQEILEVPEAKRWQDRQMPIVILRAPGAALLGFLLLTGCGAGKPATKTPASVANAAGTGTLKSLENGDRACYVGLETAAGEQAIEGDFELCPGGSKDASALIGKQVTYTTEKAKVLAASCQGDVDCGKSDEVDLIVTLSATP